MSYLIDRTFGHEELSEIAQSCLKFLLAAEPVFTLSIAGEMGVGKTTMVRELLYALGLDRSMSPNSPTFSVMNLFNVHKKQFAHIDFYRIQDVPHLLEAVVDDALLADGIFVEWLSCADKFVHQIVATHEMTLRFGSSHDPNQRSIQFRKI